jgi:1-deoxy-D-xylulose-5-phosphate synthase
MVHDVAIQNLPVVFALDRAGIVGADGATHIGAYDIAYIRCIPNMSLLTPADENECRQALSSAFAQEHPVAVRYPRGSGVGAAVGNDLAVLPWGQAELRRSTGKTSAVGGLRIAILAFGPVLHAALQAAEALDATVLNMRFVKPLDVARVLDVARAHEAIVTIEEGCVMGGAGSAVAECLAAHGLALPMLQLGLPDEFIEHGDPKTLMAMCGLDAAGIEQAVLKRFGSRLSVVRPAANH